MPSISANLNDLARLAGRDIKPADLDGILALAKAEYKDLDEATGELKIELTDTNRPDLWSVEGIARQIRGGGLDLAAEYPFFFADPDPDLRIAVDHTLAKVRPYIAGFVVDGLTVTDEALRGLIEVQEKLCEAYGRRRKTIAIGVYDADKISWPLHYDAVRPEEVRFTPLGELREMDLAEILKKHPKGLEYAFILEGHDTYPLLRDAEGMVLSFPPIINSRDLGEVKIGHSNLFVEVTGTDIHSVMIGINIFACNLADRGGRVRPCLVTYPYDTPLGREVPTPRDHARPLSLDPAHLSKLLGVEVDSAQAAKVLQSYGIRCEPKAELLVVSTPPYRADYMHPCDPVEDFAIARGFDTFEPAMPQEFTVGRVKESTSFEDAVRDIMAGFGFEEVFSNILTDPENLSEKLLLPFKGLIEIENAMSRTFSVARDRVFPSLLLVETVSLKALFPHRTFEVGEVCVREGEGASLRAVTRTRVAALVADRETGFSDIHSYLHMLLYYLDVEAALVHEDRPFFLPGRGANIVVAGQAVGIIGELHPAVLEIWGMKTPAALFELDLTALA
jgi:phenylalanyl-tRNA synthetase beta chain